MTIKPLFTVPYFEYDIPEWEYNKKQIFREVGEAKLANSNDIILWQGLETDFPGYSTSENNLPSYRKHLLQSIKPHMLEFYDLSFCTSYNTVAKPPLKKHIVYSTMWYEHTLQQPADYRFEIKNHGNVGWTAMAVIDYDEEEHTPHRLISPFNEPSANLVDFFDVPMKEGKLFIWPSYLMEQQWANTSNKPKSIIRFNFNTRPWPRKDALIIEQPEDCA
tara:strand:+ start:342 stop:998 length:657 start_codon:yes stop_codon:yes gene_type:complete